MLTYVERYDPLRQKLVNPPPMPRDLHNVNKHIKFIQLLESIWKVRNY